MFRFMRPVKTVLSVSRSPLRVAAQANRGEVHNLQGVRFQKKRFRPMAFATTVLAAYVSYNIYAMIVLEPFAAALEEAIPSPPEDEDQEPPPRIFIPLPGTTKRHEGPRFTRGHPVFQEYARIMSKPGAVKRLEGELVEHVKGIMDRVVGGNARFGPIVKVNKVWLEKSYQAAAPPMYTRTGIEITDDYISLVTEPVDIRTVSKINRLLWPSAVAQSAWSFLKVVISEEARGIARTLGLQAGDNPLTIEEILAKQVKLLSKGPEAKETQATSKQSEFFPDIQAQKSMVDAPENPSLANKKPAEKEVDELDENKIVSELSKRLSRATEAYKSQLRRTWKSGLPMDSDTVVDIMATWDLKTEKFVHDTMLLRIRGVGRVPPPRNQRSGK